MLALLAQDLTFCLSSRAAAAVFHLAPLSRYAIDYSFANAPLQRDLESDNVGATALFLCSPMAAAITGVTMYVDNGLHAMGLAVDSKAMQMN